MKIVYNIDQGCSIVIVYERSIMYMTIGTIHQLSTRDQCFGGLMIVHFYDHKPPNIPMGHYRTRRGAKVISENVQCREQHRNEW